MNVLSLARLTSPRRASLAATAAIALVGAAVLSYPLATATADPAAGTVKVDSVDVAAVGNDNSPHQACGLAVQFFGFDATPNPRQAVITFTAKPPSAPNGTAIPTVPVSPPNPAAVPFTFVGGSGAGTKPDGSITYDLDTSGLKVDNKGGYHVDVNVQIDGGSIKSKEFFVTACPSDLKIEKTASVTAPNAVPPGTTLTYTVTVTNTGRVTTTGFEVKDALEAGLSMGTVTSPAASWACSGATVDCFYQLDLAPLATATLTYTATVNNSSGGSVTNAASVSPTDATPNDNATSVTTNVSRSAVLGIVKTGPTGAGQVKHPGDTFDYTLTVSNSGNLAATSFTVTDSLPVGLTTTATPTGSGFDCTASTATVVSCSWTGSLTSASPATTARLTVPVKVDPTFLGSSLSNTGSVNQTDSNTVVTTVEMVAPTATVVKTSDASGDEQFTDDETTITPGKAVPFKLHITNTTPYAVDVVSVTDAVDGAVTGSPVTCLPALTLAVGQSGDCGFTVDSYSPADGLNKTNIATVVLREAVVNEESLPTLRRKALVANGLLSAPVKSNVAIVRTRVPGVPPPPPPPALTPVSAVAPSATQSVCVNGTATAPSYTLPTTPGVIYTPVAGGLAAAGSTVTVIAAAAPGFVLSGPSRFTLNFAAAPDCSVPGDDLGLSKGGPGNASPGDTLVYTLDVANLKGTPATGFTVTDTLPDGLSYTSADGTDFTCTAAGPVITCTYAGSLAVGQSAQIVVRAVLLDTFQGLTVTNTAVVDPGRNDTDASNNTSSVTTDVLLSGITGGGGTGSFPTPTPSPAALPSSGGAEGPLPFTGTAALSLLQTGMGLLLLGLMLTVLSRPRLRLAAGPKRGRHRRR